MLLCKMICASVSQWHVANQAKTCTESTTGPCAEYLIMQAEFHKLLPIMGLDDLVGKYDTLSQRNDHSYKVRPRGRVAFRESHNRCW